MGILASFFRFLFWVLVLSWSISLIKRFFAWFLGDAVQKQAQSPEPEMPRSKRLVRDPMCGTHVAENLAIRVRTGSEVMHFCSAECRDKYLGSGQKMAANG
jgi:YHS domain-containing protein